MYYYIQKVVLQAVLALVLAKIAWPSTIDPVSCSMIPENLFICAACCWSISSIFSIKHFLLQNLLALRSAVVHLSTISSLVCPEDIYKFLFSFESRNSPLRALIEPYSLSLNFSALGILLLSLVLIEGVLCLLILAGLEQSKLKFKNFCMSCVSVLKVMLCSCQNRAQTEHNSSISSLPSTINSSAELKPDSMASQTTEENKMAANNGNDRGRQQPSTTEQAPAHSNCGLSLQLFELSFTRLDPSNSSASLSTATSSFTPTARISGFIFHRFNRKPVNVRPNNRDLFRGCQEVRY